jgi:dihydroorotate dehydrogenase electron transfer subunit
MYTMHELTMPSPFRVAATYRENYRTKTLVMDGALDAYPGQFVMAWLPRFDEKPFSLVNSDPITLMVTAVGPFSRLLHTLAPGDPLWLRGAFGAGYQVPPGQRRLALVGGGYGVAPLLWLARAQPSAEVLAIVGAGTARDLLYVDRFADLARQRTPAAPLTLLTATEDGSAGKTGRVTDVLAPHVAAHSIDGIYACGPHGMLAALERLGAAHGVPLQLSWEAYMRCGIGICGSCEHAGAVLCMDGPVLCTP